MGLVGNGSLVRAEGLVMGGEVGFGLLKSENRDLDSMCYIVYGPQRFVQ